MKKIFALAAVAAFVSLAACSQEVPAPEAIENNTVVTDVATGEVVDINTTNDTLSK